MAITQRSKKDLIELRLKKIKISKSKVEESRAKIDDLISQYKKIESDKEMVLKEILELQIKIRKIKKRSLKPIEYMPQDDWF